MFPEIDQQQFGRIHAAGAVVVDVRGLDEYGAGHVYVICPSGRRSAEVTWILHGAGIDACNVPGGTAAWMQTGRPVETGQETAR